MPVTRAADREVLLAVYPETLPTQTEGGLTHYAVRAILTYILPPILFCFNFCTILSLPQTLNFGSYIVYVSLDIFYALFILPNTFLFLLSSIFP